MTRPARIASFRRRIRSLRWAVLVTAITATGPATTRAEATADPTDEQIELAIRRGLGYVLDRQRPDGGWSNRVIEDRYPVGIATLATFTLRMAGRPITDPALQRAIRHLVDADPPATTYERALRLLIFSSIDLDRYRNIRNADARWLITAQTGAGGWGYRQPLSRRVESHYMDNSNSQFAMLALWQAARAGVVIPRTTWQKAARHWLTAQNEDGGWGYRQPMRGGGSYGSMTAAGLATSYILYDQLHTAAEGTYNGKAAPRCGLESSDAKEVRIAIEDGLDWIGREFTLETVPEAPNFVRPFLTYYHFSLERVGIASGHKRFGPHDWHARLAHYLLENQEPKGNWGNIAQTCFALLALLKGRAPVLINKLKYEGDYDNDPRDAARFTEYISKHFERPVSWQLVSTDQPADLHDAPVLYFNGHHGPRFDEHQTRLLREFIKQGGTILAVACCSEPQFAKRTGEYFTAAFPDLTPRSVGPDHPLWTIHFRLKPAFRIRAWDDGCRTRIFLLEDDLCCAWHQGLDEKFSGHFELGANLVFYATDRAPLTRKRRSIFVPSQPPAAAPRLTIARLKHDADYDTDPLALEKLADALYQTAGWHLEIREPRTPDQADPKRIDVLWLTGHTAPTLSDADIESLRAFLAGGGFLVANPACGRQPFAQTIEKIAPRIVDAPLVDLPEDHPIRRGTNTATPYSDLSQVHYKRGAGTRPVNYATIFAKLGFVNSRPALFYSRYDLTCGLDGHPCPSCLGLVPRDATALGVNVLLAAIQARDQTNPRPSK